MSACACRSLLTVLVLTCAASHVGAMTMSEYRARMEEIQSALEDQRLDQAKRVASQLDDATVTADGVSFKTDSSILKPIQNAKGIADAEPQKKRIKALLDATADRAAEHPSADPDKNLLNKIRHDEEVTLPPRDGQIRNPDIAETGFFYEVTRHIVQAVKWIVEKLGDLVKWIGKLVPAPSGGGSGVGAAVNYLIVIAALIAVGLVVHAWLKKRRFKPVAVAESTAPAVLAKDADPLSRGADEWEEYAAQLASTGRYREAIRAWYHAALVLLFRAGVLSYRKGRTNWEYCYSLEHDISWRPKFQELTSVFEVEWYGKTSSTVENAREYGDAAKEFLGRARGGRNA